MNGLMKVAVMVFQFTVLLLLVHTDVYIVPKVLTDGTMIKLTGNQVW